MKIKKFISLLASLAMMVTALTGAMSVSAETDSGDCGEVKWSFDSSTGKLTISGEGAMASPDVNFVGQGLTFDEMESQMNNYTDTYTYQKYKDIIKEVIIEEGVTSIGYGAFYQFPNLETVVLPSTITEFVSVDYDGQRGYFSCAFARCPLLKNLTLTEGMTAIGGRAFYYCESLDSVRIPSTLLIPTNESGGQDIYGRNGWGLNTFEGCSSLKNIILSEGLTVMGAAAFRYTPVESIIIPSTIKTWVKYPAPNDNSTTNGAFEGCEKLSSVTFTEGLKCINATPFLGCSMLKKVVIPASVTDITWAFCGKNNRHPQIEEVIFEDGSQLKEIGVQSFYLCDKLQTIEIPENVTKISDGYLKHIDSIKTVYVYSRTVDAYNLPTNATVFCYSDAVVKGQRSCLDIENEISKALQNLNTAVKEAEKYSEEDYTTSSYGKLKALLDQAATKDDESHILGMKYLTEDIYTAIEGLRDKSEEPSSSDPSSSDPSDSSNPSGSDQSQPSNSGSSQPTSAQPVTNAPTTATPKPITPPTVTTAAKPAQVKAVKLKAKKKKLNVSWKKVSGATGYEVMSATNNKFTKNKKTVTVKKNKVTLKKLKPKKKYFVKVRAYKLANGRKYFGKWSKVVKKKVK